MVTGDGGAATFERRAGSGGSRARLLGRDEELAELAAVWDGGLLAPPAAVVVVGPWGSGKTALLRSGAWRAQQAGSVVVVLQGHAAERRHRFALVGDALHGLRRGWWDAPAALEQLGSLLQRPALSVREAAAQLGDVLVSRPSASVTWCVDDADQADGESIACLWL